MKILKIAVIVIGVITVLVLGFAYYAGFFTKVSVSEKMMGPYTIVYESYTGDYKDTGKVFDKVNNDMKNEGIETSKAIGIYYDNPSDVPADKLRSDCGVILEEKDLSKSADLAKKFKVKTIEQKNSVVSEFPIKGPLSYMVGPMMVYPVIMKHAVEKGYKMVPCIELYDMPGNMIYYIMPIEK